MSPRLPLLKCQCQCVVTSVVSKIGDEIFTGSDWKQRNFHLTRLTIEVIASVKLSVILLVRFLANDDLIRLSQMSTLVVNTKTH